MRLLGTSHDGAAKFAMSQFRRFHRLPLSPRPASSNDIPPVASGLSPGHGEGKDHQCPGCLALLPDRLPLLGSPYPGPRHGDGWPRPECFSGHPE